MVLVTQWGFFLLMNLLWHLFLKMKIYYILRNTLRVQNLYRSEMELRSGSCRHFIGNRSTKTGPSLKKNRTHLHPISQPKASLTSLLLYLRACKVISVMADSL